MEPVRIRRESAAPSSEPFLTLERATLRLVFADGTTSAPFAYDWIGRRALDAVVIVPHFRGPDGALRTFLRSAIRPPLVLRATPPFTDDPVLFELPAGLVEPGEEPVQAAARELDEELGFAVAASAFVPLGSWAYPAPGFVGERHLFFRVPVDVAAQRRPTEDGSVLEAHAQIVQVTVAEALALARDGRLRDSKTELALRRLVEIEGDLP